ncbi:hypothetical protein PHAVU_009G040900 [Phaseolus vulgaris]
METLKAAIPESLKRAIADSNVDDLQSTCSSLHRFFLHFDPFHQIITQLADPKYGLCGKSEEDALKSKQLGNECFSNADYAKALDCYTQALRKAPLDTGDRKSNLVATLYINRATVLHKMSLLVECLRDCTRALKICPSYAKAWYRRGKANASLGNYRNAICDLNVAKIVEPSLGGKRQIEVELKILLDQCKSTSAAVQIQHKDNSCNTVGEMPQMKLQCVSMPDKGRGMVSSCVISPGSLVHSEEPYAMIILKQCRETHCHYCLNDLPADRVPCISCSIPLYCSHQCQIRAGGQMFRIYPENNDTFKKMPSDLGEYASEVIQSDDSEQEIEDITEHKHECGGVHWPVVLPSEIVLTGRILAGFLLNSTSENIVNFVERLELSHCYKHMSSESKLDSHIYATVLLYCLQHSCETMFSIDGVSISQVVIIISQIKVNCMTIVRLKSIDAHGGHFGEFPFQYGAHSTSNVEQVRVGKAIYKAGSLFNHSCQPNVHAYFLSRTLYLRTTHGVAAGCQLELSYGPQVDKNDDISVCLNVFKQNGAYIHGQPGYCLKCGSYCDLESSQAAVSEALICIKRLQDAILLKEISSITISDALISLQSLRLNLHAYNKLIAEAEDSIAQAFCLVGELQLSVDHCKASIQILEKLYDTDDIVIAYELVKLSSILLSLDDSTAAESINRIDDIFSRYYGLHADLVFPDLQYLRKEIEKFSVKAIQ